MTVSTSVFLQASPATALPGTWKLARGRAITLQPGISGILRVAHGRMWVTTDGPHGHGPSDSGDHVLEVGRSMFVRAGQRVVAESWSTAGSAYFSWDPVPVAAAAPVPPRRPVCFALVTQPLADLRMAVALGLRASGRLAAGAIQLGLEMLPWRHRGYAPARRAWG